MFTTRITNILDGKHTGHWAQGQDIVDYIYLHTLSNKTVAMTWAT